MPTDHRDEYELASSAAKRLKEIGFADALVAIQTGSGIAAPALEGRTTLAWSEIPGFPQATAPGHRGLLHHGRIYGVPVVVLEGRLHLYEGHAPAEVVRPIRALALAGVRRAILTNASGGIREDLTAGDVVRVTDHINLMRADPLTGIHDPRFGDRFTVTAGTAHDATLGRYAEVAAKAAGVRLYQGVYAAVAGPSFETPAEVRMLRALGADIVGMSTVPEVLAAAQMRMRVLVLSLVANPAGLVKPDATAESEVLAVGASRGVSLLRVVEGVVTRIGKESR
jgi:purine-nucleoside phosphorylase